jgi:replicative DNA helicase
MAEKVVNQHVQDCFALLCITSTDFLNSVRTALEPRLFTAAVTAHVVKVCYDYYDVFDEAPADHFQDEWKRREEEVPQAEREMWVSYVSRISEMNIPNENYIIRCMSDFIKARTLEGAAVEFAELVVRGDFIKARNMMHDALKAGIEREEVGFKYLSEVARFKNAGIDEELLMTTGIEALDNLIKGYRRSQFVCLMGGYKGMKSWACMHLAKTAMLHGLNVLHISHEMTVAQIEARYDMMVGSMVSHHQPDDVSFLRWSDDEDAENLNATNWGWKREIIERPTIWDPVAVNAARRKLRRFGGKLVVRKYPMGSCSMSDIYAYLNHLETYEKFIPDVIINDYADIMAPLNSNDHRDNLNKLYVAHKRLADERNILVVTVSQVTRDAIRKEVLSMKDFAEDIRKAGNVDLALAICQSDNQKRNGFASMFVVANRDGVMDCGCRIGTNLDAGQFCFWSAPMDTDFTMIPGEEEEEE